MPLGARLARGAPRPGARRPASCGCSSSDGRLDRARPRGGDPARRASPGSRSACAAASGVLAWRELARRGPPRPAARRADLRRARAARGLAARARPSRRTRERGRVPAARRRLRRRSRTTRGSRRTSPTYVGVDIAANPAADVHGHGRGAPASRTRASTSSSARRCSSTATTRRRRVRELRRVIAPGGRVLASTHGVQVYHPSPARPLALDARGPRAPVPRRTATGRALRVRPGSRHGRLPRACCSRSTSTSPARRAHVAPLGRPVDRARSTRSRSAVDGARRVLREPVPGTLLANYHVTREVRMSTARRSSPAAAGSSARTSCARCSSAATTSACSTTSRPATARNLADIADEIEVVEGELRSYERVHNADARRRGRLPPGRAAVGAALGAGPADDERRERRGDAERAARRARRGRPARRLRVVVVRLRQHRDAPARRDAVPRPDLAVRGREARGRALLRLASARVYGLETVVLRYFNVFGPRQDPTSQYAAVVPRFIAAVAAGEPVPIYGDGEQSRDFTYVENVVDANLRAADAPEASRHVINVATGEPRERQRARRHDRRGARQAGREGVPAAAHRRRPRLVGRRRRGASACSAGSRRSGSRKACALTADAFLGDVPDARSASCASSRA